MTEFKTSDGDMLELEDIDDVIDEEFYENFSNKFGSVNEICIKLNDYLGLLDDTPNDNKLTDEIMMFINTFMNRCLFLHQKWYNGK